MLDRDGVGVRSKPPLVPDDVAPHAAALVKQGYETDVEVMEPGSPDGTTRIHLQLFHNSNHEAADSVLELAAILKRYGVNNHQLLQRICAVDGISNIV
jgi:hypothetical protein